MKIGGRGKTKKRKTKHAHYCTSKQRSVVE